MTLTTSTVAYPSDSWALHVFVCLSVRVSVCPICVQNVRLVVTAWTVSLSVNVVRVPTVTQLPVNASVLPDGSDYRVNTVRQTIYYNTFTLLLLIRY